MKHGVEAAKVKAELDSLCAWIEKTWSGVHAVYQTFPAERPHPAEVDCIIDVFSVEESLEEDIIRGTYPWRKKLRREHDYHVSIVCHDPSVVLS